MAELTDQQKVERGIARLDALAPEDRAVMYEELEIGVARLGKHPNPRVVCHVAGNVTDEEWAAALSRIPAWKSRP